MEYAEITTTKKEIVAKAIIENVNEYQQRYWLHGLFYEYDLLDYIDNHYKSGTIIDVGSCIGNHMLFFSKIAENVYSFEPCLPNFVLQYHNILLNELQNVKLFNCALGDKNKIANIDYKRDNKILTNHPLKEHKSGINNTEYVTNYGNSQIVDIKTKTLCILKCLDDFDIEDVSIIKIDVEGYELNVLKGAINTIKKYKPDLYMEITNEKQYNEILEFLMQFKYDTVISFPQHHMYRIYKK